MPTRNVSLTEHFDQFVEDSIDSGQYLNASEVVRDALRLLESRQKEERLKLQRLREAVEVGLAELDRGEYREIDADKIEHFIAELGERAAQRRREPRS